MKVNLITAPDKLLNRNKSYLLVAPSERIKQDFNEAVKSMTADINLYFWEEYENNPDVSWLIDVANIVDVIIIDTDNMTTNEWLIGYFLGFNNTYYLTTSETRVYNNICMNRVYDLTWLESGDTIETK